MSFKRLDPEDFIFSAESTTAPAWSTNKITLEEMQTSSVQEGGFQGNYYLSIFQTNSVENSSQVQFDIAFGDKEGRGASPYTTGLIPSYTSTIYGQYQNIIYGDENNDFFFNNISQSAFYALNVSRNRYKEKLLPGTFNIRLTDELGDNTLVLTDNSKDITSLSFTEAGRVYQLVSGSNGKAISQEVTPESAIAPGMTKSGSYGLFLPDIGTIILNAPALDNPVVDGGIVLGTDYTTAGDEKNPSTLFNFISRSADFKLNYEETITSDFVFIRARNAEFNYSENPSYISGSQGVVIYDQFINNPQTYITSVGLYNDNNDLLAVAKLSKPLKKDFTKEALIRVKLDF